MNKIDAKMGGSMVYVMVLIAFLGILSTGFLYMTEYSRRAVMSNRACIEAQTTARGIHQSFCEAVSGKTSEAMDLLWACFEEDCETVRGEYEMPAGEGEPQADSEGTLAVEESGDDPGGAVPLLWEAFLRDRLEEKAYAARGSAELPGRVSVSVTLTAFPLKGKATVNTTVACNGYRFSMNGNILFNNQEGDMMDLGQGLGICMEGRGVSRYYGD